MSSSGQFVLLVEGPDGSVREHVLGALPLVVGRDDSADIRVDDRKVSRRHAAFRVADGQVWVEDLGSVNGVRLNGKKISQKAVLLPSDVINMGAYALRVRAPRGAVAESPGPAETRSRVKASVVAPTAEATRGMRAAPPPTPLQTGEAHVQIVLFGQTAPIRGKRFSLSMGESLVGRLDEHAIQILDVSVSRTHARIVVSSSGVRVVDLGSSNGTFVGDVRVDEAELSSGDQVRFGTVELRVELPPTLPGRQRRLEPSRMHPTRAAGRPRSLYVGAATATIATVGLGALVWLRPAWLPGLRGGVSASNPAETAAPETAPPETTAPKTTPATPAPSALAAPPPSPVVAPAPTVAAQPTPTAAPSTAPTAAPSAALPAAAPATAAPRPALAARTRTATSPFSRRDADGAPSELPSVDETLDFDAVVADRLARAAALEGEHKFADVRRLLAELLTLDPINGDALVIKRRVDLAEKAQRVLEEGDALRGQRQLVKALELYQAVPAGTPQRALADERIAQLKPVAIAAELELVNIALKRPKTWPSAHERLVAVLEIDPTHVEAKQTLAELEERLRKENMGFVPYGEKAAGPAEAAVPRAEAIAKKWDDRVLQRIVAAYADGDLRGAVRRAEGLARRAKPKSDAKALYGTLKRIEAKYERARNELANDPAQAWAQLLELAGIERELLPEGVESFIVSELERSVADAFVARGERLAAEQRYEQAFQQYDAAGKVVPRHPKVVDGLARLEEVAEGWAREAELATQRGQPEACDSWKRITRTTRADSEAHKRARARIERCP